jgi:hypothetical protein
VHTWHRLCAESCSLCLFNPSVHFAGQGLSNIYSNISYNLLVLKLNIRECKDLWLIQSWRSLKNKSCSEFELWPVWTLHNDLLPWSCLPGLPGLRNVAYWIFQLKGLSCAVCAVIHKLMSVRLALNWSVLPTLDMSSGRLRWWMLACWTPRSRLRSLRTSIECNATWGLWK